MRRLLAGCVSAALAGSVLTATAAPQQRQPVPRPFPRQASPSEEAPAIEPATDPLPRLAPSQVQAPPITADSVPTAATLGYPIYPNAQFITSYEAGRGQRYYLFGTNSSFEEMVRYYAVILDERGDRVFDGPATHMFEVGRFREEEMAFPPGVTVKDYTWNGSEGYLNPTGGEPASFRTIILIVPGLPEQARR